MFWHRPTSLQLESAAVLLVACVRACMHACMRASTPCPSPTPALLLRLWFLLRNIVRQDACALSAVMQMPLQHALKRPPEPQQQRGSETAKCRRHVIDWNCLNRDYADEDKAVVPVTTAVDVRESSHCPQHDSGKVTSSDCVPTSACYAPSINTEHPAV